MAIRDDELEGGLFEAFKTPEGESILKSIERLHGVGSSILLRDVDDGASPVLLRREEHAAAQDDSRYQILGEIARGGIGVVYKGRDKDLNRDIALKVLRPEYKDRDDVVQRFIEEAQVGGQLQHPGIVPIYGIGLQDDGRPSFAMKLINGQTLAELLDSNPKKVDLLAVFEQMAQTMAYAHSRGVIHRDLKPANIMIGAFGEVQIVDWGFAKVLGQQELKPRPEQTMIATVRSESEGSQSIAGSVMGTPAYMPPEQAMGQIEDLDERSDVFALGAILCEILTGRAPYEGEQKDQLIAASQCRLEPALERLDACDAADGLKKIVRKCLQPLMADRPKTAGVLADRVAEHFASVEERARQSELDALEAETRVQRARKGRKRALMATGIALLLVLGGGGGTFAWKRAKDAREKQAAPKVAAALQEATEAEGRQDWETAVAAARKAKDIAASEGVADAAPRALVARLQSEKDKADEANRLQREDDEFLAELENIRGRRGQAAQLGGSGGASEVEGDKGTDAAYLDAFKSRFGSIEASERRLTASRHAEAFAANLGFWCWLRKTQLKAPGWESIDRLARRVDPGNEDVRDALMADDVEALLRITQRGDDLPLALAAQVGLALAYKDGQAGAAVAFLKEQHRRAPGDFWIHMRLGYAAEKLEDLDLSVRHSTAAIALRPKHFMAWHSLGLALFNKGALDGAIQAYRRALELDPKFVPAHVNLGTALFQKGALDGAIQEYRRALELDPKFVHAHRNLGVALNKRFGPALSSALKGAEPPGDALERLGFAELCTYRRRHADAARFYGLAFQADPKLSVANGYAAGRAAAMAGKGHRKHALAWLRAHLEWLRGQSRTVTAAALERWKFDDALNDVDPEMTDDLGPEWKKLWADVDALRQRAKGASK